MFKNNKSFWELGKIEKRIGNMVYIIQGPKFSHKRHLNQLRKRLSDNTDSASQEEEEIIDTIYDTFDIEIPQAAPEPRQSKRKRKLTDLIVIDPKRKRY